MHKNMTECKQLSSLNVGLEQCFIGNCDYFLLQFICHCEQIKIKNTGRLANWEAMHTGTLCIADATQQQPTVLIANCS